MAKKQKQSRPPVSLGTIFIWIAAAVNLPRYAGAFLYSDLEIVPPIISQIMNYANIVGGIAMGLLETVSIAYIMDSLRKTQLLITRRGKKGEKDWRELNWRWVLLAFFGLVQLALAPFILVPYMVARMNGEPMHTTLSNIMPGSPIIPQVGWNFVVVMAPIVVVGAASFAQSFITHGQLTETTVNSTQLTESFPKDWRKVSHEQKLRLAKMSKDDMVAKGIQDRTALNWLANLREEGYIK